MRFTSINPATDQILAEYAAFTPETVEKVISSAYAEQQRWSDLSITDRCLIVRDIGHLLRERVEEAALVISAEMGKPMAEAVAEVRKCADVCMYMADTAIDVLRDETVATQFASSTIRYEALGVILSIMPWNFPFWQFFRFAAPSLCAGNAILLKHAPTTWGSALMAADICKEAGVPEALVQCLMVDVPEIEHVIADRRISGVTFTGSTGGGRSVGALAGKYLKKSVLELGGSDAYIVLDDADIHRAAVTCVQQRLRNAGQSCIAAKRFIVHESVAEEFKQHVIAEMNKSVVGDPSDATSTMGPLARTDLKATLLDQVARAIGEGAQLIVNGRPADVDALDVPGDGAFVKPGLLVNVKPGSVADQEELFGPVAALITVSSDEEALAVANGNDFGLGAAVFSKSLDRAKTFVEKLEAGSVFINDFVRSDSRMPFGGTKDSGYGRELGEAGILEFVTIKSVVEP